MRWEDIKFENFTTAKIHMLRLNAGIQEDTKVEEQKWEILVVILSDFCIHS